MCECDDKSHNFGLLQEFFKEHLVILESNSSSYGDKASALVEAWKIVWNCERQNVDYCVLVRIINCAKKHTFAIVFHLKYSFFKVMKADVVNNLLTHVKLAEIEAQRKSEELWCKFRNLERIIINPWDYKVLTKMLNDPNTTVQQREVDFFCEDTPHITGHRLYSLVNANLEHTALNLGRCFMEYVKLSKSNYFTLPDTNDTHVNFCLDVYIALLVHFDKRHDLATELKKMKLEDGLLLVERLKEKNVAVSNVWRNRHFITQFVCEIFVAMSMLKDFAQVGPIAKQFMEILAINSLQHNFLDRLEATMRTFVTYPSSAHHIYMCAEVLMEKAGSRMRSFVTELFVMALTTDINKLKYVEDAELTVQTAALCNAIKKSLAKGFTHLAEVFKEFVQLSRECVLTAFSLEPSLELMEKLEGLAAQSGFEVKRKATMWRCSKHKPADPEAEEVCWMCPSCGDWRSRPHTDFHLATNFALNEVLDFNVLQIKPELCDDLAVVLNAPRYHLLSWLLRWDDLQQLCEMYMNDQMYTRNFITDLKFIKIDYSMFDDTKPFQQAPGVEAGYEQYLIKDDDATVANSLLKENLKKLNRAKVLPPLPAIFKPVIIHEQPPITCYFFE